MFDRIKRSFDLVRASVHVLRRNRQLLWFPVISALALILLVAAFALPLFGVAAFDGMGRGGKYSAAFLFYVVEYFVIFYFNAALVGAVMIRLDGGVPTLTDGLRIANRRFGAILGYAVIAATVGVVLRAVQERLGFVGRLIVGLLGASWAVATFHVVPVIVMRDRGALDSISESTALLKRTWGENLVGQVGLGAAFALVYFGMACATMVVALLLISNATVVPPVLIVAFILVVVVAVVACVLFHATLSGIYSAVLYRYAVDGDAAPGFDRAALAASFRDKS